MKTTVYLDEFRNYFAQIRPDNFSHEGLGVLFDYLEEANPEMELDVIGICCDFSQCSLDEFIDSFAIKTDEDVTEDQKRAFIEDYINSHGFFYQFVENGKEIVFENF